MTSDEQLDDLLVEQMRTMDDLTRSIAKLRSHNDASTRMLRDYARATKEYDDTITWASRKLLHAMGVKDGAGAPFDAIVRVAVTRLQMKGGKRDGTTVDIPKTGQDSNE